MCREGQFSIEQYTAAHCSITLKVKYKSSMVTQVTASQIGPFVPPAVCSVHCVVYNDNFKICSLQCALCILQSLLFSGLFSVFSLQFLVCNFQFTEYILLPSLPSCPVFSIQCLVCSLQFAVCKVQFTVCSE